MCRCVMGMAVLGVGAVVFLFGHDSSGGKIPLEGMFGLALYTPIGYIASMKNETKQSCMKRLGRVEGQVRGVARMVEDDRYCIDVITQISAIRAALKRVEEEVLKDHVAHCVEHAIVSGKKDEQRKKIAELMDVLGRLQN
jgi:CsoR family transcriptional regulator, copper-sensing transcriptional repressor